MTLGESPEFDIMSKIINSMTSECERKILAIKEANDLSTLKPGELTGKSNVL